MNKTKKRALSLFLSFVMVLTSLPSIVFADYLDYYEEETKHYYIEEEKYYEYEYEHEYSYEYVEYEYAYEYEYDSYVFSLSHAFAFSEGIYTLFSLQEELLSQGPGPFSVPIRLQGAGVSGYISEIDGSLYLGFTGRTAGWNGIDIHREGLYIGDTITVAGYAVNPPAGTIMILGGAEPMWDWANNVSVSIDQPQFLLEVTLTETHFLESTFERFRIQTNGEGASMDFYLYEIRISRTEDSTPFVPPAGPGPEPELPVVDGELVFNLATYDYVLIDGVTDLSDSLFLSASGNPTIIRYNGSLYVTDRATEWYAVDINLVGLDLGATYLFYASGTGTPGTQIGLHRSDAPWAFITGGMVVVDSDGNWESTVTLVYPPNPAMPAVRIQTNHPQTTDFVIDNIRIYRIEDAPLVFETLHNISSQNMQSYESFLSAGDQMSGEITPNGFRLQNITGDYTSGNGNYLRFDLPYPIAPATDLRISWDVYIPSAENPGIRNIVGPGLVINSNFGQPPSQPTNNIDLNRTIPMDEWVNTSVEFMVSHEVGDSLDHLIFRFRVNDNVQQPTVLYINNIIIEYGGAAEFVAPEWDLSLPSLAEAFAPFFAFGNIYATHAIMNQFGTREAFVHHFNAITAENWHKPDHIAGPGGLATRPAASDFNFDSADAIVDFAIENDLMLIGHAFVWHSQTPAWMFGPEGARLTRQEARDNMEFYIRTLSEHFTERGTIDAFHSWDVVNEVIASGGGDWGGPLDDWNAGDWRTQMRTQSGWWEAYSNNPNPAEGDHPSDFVYDAFVFARRFFPNTILYYNDYNEEIPAKRNAIGQMIEQINERWAHDFVNNPEAVFYGQVYTGRKLIEGFGLQSHFHYPMGGWSTNFDNIRPSLERFAATGVILSISELDITFGGFGAGAQTFPDGLPEEWANRQAEIYARLIGYYLEFSNYIERLSIWGLADNQSWRAAGHPLLFDSQFTAKPAFFAILDAVNNFDGPFFVSSRPPVITAPSNVELVFESGSTEPQFIYVAIANDPETVTLFADIVWLPGSGGVISAPPIPLASRALNYEPIPIFTQSELINELITWDNENGRVVINPGLPDLSLNQVYAITIIAENEYGSSTHVLELDIRDTSVTSLPTITGTTLINLYGSSSTLYFDFEITQNASIVAGLWFQGVATEEEMADFSWIEHYTWQQFIETTRWDFRNNRLSIEGPLPEVPDGFSMGFGIQANNRYGSVSHHISIIDEQLSYLPIITAPSNVELLFEAGSTEPQFIYVAIANNPETVTLFTNPTWRPEEILLTPVMASSLDEDLEPEFNHWELINELITWDNENSRIVINPGLPDLAHNFVYSINITATNEFGTEVHNIYADIRDTSVTSAPTITGPSVVYMDGNLVSYDFEITGNPYLSAWVFAYETFAGSGGSWLDWSWFDYYVGEQLSEAIRFDFRNNRLILEGYLPQIPPGFSIGFNITAQNRYGFIVHEILIADSRVPVITAPSNEEVEFEAGSKEPQFIYVTIENNPEFISLFLGVSFPPTPPTPLSERTLNNNLEPAYSQWELISELITWDNENSRIVIHPGLPDLPLNGVYVVTILAQNEFGFAVHSIALDIRDSSVTAAPTITGPSEVNVPGNLATYDFEITGNPFVSTWLDLDTINYDSDWSWIDDYIWQQILEVIRFDFRNNRLILEGSLPEIPDGYYIVFEIIASNRYGFAFHEVYIIESEPAPRPSIPSIPWHYYEIDEEPVYIPHRWTNQTSTWATYSEDVISIIVDGQTQHSVETVTVNGRVLTRGLHFIVPAGTSRIELLPSFLETLNAGTHVLEVLFLDNTITSALFTITEGTPPAVEAPEEYIPEEEVYEEYEEILPTIEEVIEEIAEDTFVDVSPSDWFYDDVNFVFENGIMNGMSTREMRFEPHTYLSFAMLIRALYNLEGLSNGIDHSWYESPVAWAIENNIIESLDDPLANIEIEDLILILTNYSQFLGTSLADLLEYALNTEFSPSENVTRAEFATIIRNFVELP